MNTYTIVYLQADAQYAQDLISLSIKNFSCAGVEEYSLDPTWINKFLGQRVLVEWEIPAETYEQIDAAMADNAQVYKFYFTGPQHQQNAAAFEHAAASMTPIKAYQEQAAEQDWNEEWKKGYHKIEVSSKMAVLPVWQAAEKTNYEIPIIINPGMGFGTGTHETTFLCLQQIEAALGHQDPAAKIKFLDFGCGSGILGMAALKLGAEQVDFCDIDEQALANCADNLNLNFAPQQIEAHTALYTRTAFVPAEQTYDLVVANILLSALESENKILRTVVKVGGLLIISGIFTDQMPAIEQLYREQADTSFALRTSQSKGEWAVMVWQRTR
ncbi:MAG: 50S ribosomal protein L11 methyltransferase [Bacteriovoracaceae bacterium]|nr:50S ribosomal protein L11 methyltransferase [Bacteriovoracaceae bacterium]